jgi:hypothetical protein
MVYLSCPNNRDTKDLAEVSKSLRPCDVWVSAGLCRVKAVCHFELSR